MKDELQIVAAGPEGERRSTKVKRARLLRAMQKNAGIVSYAIKAAKVSIWFYYDQYKNNPEFRREVEEIQNARLDMAEATLLKGIREGDKICTIFYLKTKGKHRGYVEAIQNINTDLVIHVIRRD